jgi:hypothetical protein
MTCGRQLPTTTTCTRQLRWAGIRVGFRGRAAHPGTAARGAARGAADHRTGDQRNPRWPVCGRGRGWRRGRGALARGKCADQCGTRGRSRNGSPGYRQTTLDGDTGRKALARMLVERFYDYDEPARRALAYLMWNTAAENPDKFLAKLDDETLEPHGGTAADYPVRRGTRRPLSSGRSKSRCNTWSGTPMGSRPPRPMSGRRRPVGLQLAPPHVRR